MSAATNPTYNPFDHWPLRRWQDARVAYRWDCWRGGHVWLARTNEPGEWCGDCGKLRP